MSRVASRIANGTTSGTPSPIPIPITTFTTSITSSTIAIVIGITSLSITALSITINPPALYAQSVPDSLNWTQSYQGDKESGAMEQYIRGVFQLQNRDYSEALESLQAAHTLLPDEPAVNHALSDTYLGLGDGVNAEYYAKTAVRLAPENIWYHLSLAGIYEAEGRTEAVLETYKKARDIHPDQLSLLTPMAEAFTQLGELRQANEIYDQMIRLQGGSASLFMNKYWNNRALGDDEDALKALKAIRDIEPDNLTNLRLMASNYMEQGRVDEAFAILTDLKNRNARDIQTMLMLVQFHLEQNDWEAFRQVAEALIQDPFFYPSDKLEFSRYLLTLVEDLEFRDHVEQLILLFAAQEPDFEPAQELLSAVYQSSGREELALQNLREINQKTPENTNAWVERFALLYRLERFDELIIAADSAQSYLQDAPQTLYQIGRALLLTGDPERAATWLEEASFSPAPRSLRSAIQLDLGHACLENGDLGEASRNYETALRLEEDNLEAQAGLLYLEALDSDVTRRNRLLQEAIRLWEQVAGEDPSRKNLPQTIARARKLLEGS